MRQDASHNLSSNWNNHHSLNELLFFHAILAYSWQLCRGPVWSGATFPFKSWWILLPFSELLILTENTITTVPPIYPEEMKRILSQIGVKPTDSWQISSVWTLVPTTLGYGEPKVSKFDKEVAKIRKKTCEICRVSKFLLITLKKRAFTFKGHLNFKLILHVFLRHDFKRFEGVNLIKTFLEKKKKRIDFSHLGIRSLKIILGLRSVGEF